jgi:hypothetical protein
MTEHAEHQEADSRGRLRSAMLHDGQAAFPLWLPLPGFVAALVWALYQAVTSDAGGPGEFAAQLAWPGIAIFVALTAVAYFGWRLDLD